MEETKRRVRPQHCSHRYGPVEGCVAYKANKIELIPRFVSKNLLDPMATKHYRPIERFGPKLPVFTQRVTCSLCGDVCELTNGKVLKDIIESVYIALGITGQTSDARIQEIEARFKERGVTLPATSEEAVYQLVEMVMSSDK